MSCIPAPRSRTFALLCFPALFLFYSCASVKSYKPHEISSQTGQSIDSICGNQIKTGHFPGLAVAVASKGKRIWTKGYGYSDMEKKTVVDPREDLFRIGSVSKTVTACALARLVEKDKIDLDAPVSNYLDSLPQDKADLTLRQLGGHLAGIRHYKGVEFFSNVHYNNAFEPLEVFINDSLLCEPGTKYNYSTYGWTLISAVMEMAMQKTFVELVEEEVSKPLRLSDLKADLSEFNQYRRVHFYEYLNGGHVPSPVVDNSNKWAGGGFICSAEDLARFGYALVEPGYLKEETLSSFTRSQETANGEKTNYGIGFRISKDDKGRVWYGHSGGSIGGTSMLLIYPEEDLVVVTLVNQTGADMEDLAWKIAEVFLEKIR
jgi:serine beta-lactamase-like protein LACTB, mitochondrial